MPAPNSSPVAAARRHRILVRGVNWLGDAVMTTPALQRLREHFPQSGIALLTPAKLAMLWTVDPNIDEVIPLPSGETPWSLRRLLRPKAFDLALILPNSPRSALEAWFARIPERVGYRRPWRNWLLTRAIPSRTGCVVMRKRSAREVRRLIARPLAAGSNEAVPPSAHQVHDYLALAGALGANPEPRAPRLYVQDVEVAAAAARFGLSRALAPGGRPLVGLNAGAEYGPAKRWPLAQFVAAAAEVQRRTRCQWLIFGGRGDIAVAGEIEAGLRAAPPAAGDDPASAAPVNVAGKTSLRELMALLRLCRLLLTNDTGPMHVAAAVGTPVVVPFGSTSPALTGPGLPGDPRHVFLSAGVPCSPCFLPQCPIDFRCMTGITPEQVVRAILALLPGP